jgi:hypothetical protein
MIKYFSICLVVLVMTVLSVQGQAVERVTYAGKLERGTTRSIIFYLSSETGDLTAFCFLNRSSAGRKILARCKNGANCEFSGSVDWSADCKVKMPGGLSVQAKVLTVTKVRSRRWRD